MQQEKITAQSVFVQTGFPRYTYAERKKYDSIFKSALKDGGVHIYLYGISKSGKTSMWKNYIRDEEYIEIKISKTMTLDSFYRELLDRIQPYYLKEYSELTGSESKVGAGLKANFLSLSANGKTENVDSTSKDTQYERLFSPEIGLTYITQAAKSASKIIILEDFQTASDSFVKDLANVLKAFADDQIKVIIVGTDDRSDLIFQARNDIISRLLPINLDRFKRDELLEIITKGEEALNIKISDDVKNFIISNSYERAYILQRICRYLCEIENVETKLLFKKQLSSSDSAEKACELLATSLDGTYEKPFLSIARAGTKGNKSDTYRWVLRALRSDLKLINGKIEAKVIANEIIRLSNTFNPASIYPCLKNMISRQGQSKIFKYEDKCLYIVDFLFLFFLKWSDVVKEELM